MKGHLINITAVKNVMERMTGKPVAPHLYAGELCDVYVCEDCGEEFLKFLNAKGNLPKCNGHYIDLCPWCRPDSEEGKYGR